MKNKDYTIPFMFKGKQIGWANDKGAVLITSPEDLNKIFKNENIGISSRPVNPLKEIDDKDLVEKARVFAKHYHDNPSGSQRYGNMPYSTHVESVADNGKKYIYYIPEEDRDIVIIACYLHDLIEDTEITYKKIAQQFGFRVADIVYRVSNERGRDRKESNFKTYPKVCKIWRCIFQL